MSSVFVVKNQQGYFATKQKEWECGRDPKLLFRTAHKDEAINMVFELSSKDIDLRAEVITVDQDDKKHPVVGVTVPPTVKEEVEAMAPDDLTAAEA
ncbi:MAG: hypothetical protein V7459_09445 [Oceanicoccus sp.]